MNNIVLLLYFYYKAFNNILSSERITIERAFGMFVRKWGILWRPLEYSVKDDILILMTCAKLHNFSIDHWMKAGTHFNVFCIHLLV